MSDIRAWKDEDFRDELSLAHPSGEIDLSSISGANAPKLPLGSFHIVCGISWALSCTCETTISYGTCGVFSVGCC